MFFVGEGEKKLVAITIVTGKVYFSGSGLFLTYLDSGLGESSISSFTAVYINSI